MKATILLFLILLFLSSCQKDAQDLPEIKQPVSTSSVVTQSLDAMPDNAAFKIQLVKDNINSDDTMILFKQKAQLGYDPYEDGIYVQGNGQVNLASISSDNTDLAINTLPYTPGMSIGLYMTVKSDGAYSLQLDYQKSLPANTHIWLKDTYLKDSIDVRTKAYKFIVTKADTNSFGSKRFKLTIR